MCKRIHTQTYRHTRTGTCFLNYLFLYSKPQQKNNHSRFCVCYTVFYQKTNKPNPTHATQYIIVIVVSGLSSLGIVACPGSDRIFKYLRTQSPQYIAKLLPSLLSSTSSSSLSSYSCKCPKPIAIDHKNIQHTPVAHPHTLIGCREFDSSVEPIFHIYLPTNSSSQVEFIFSTPPLSQLYHRNHWAKY